jgi:hypothetical protein
MIVELQVEAIRLLARWEIRQRHPVEPAGRYRAAGERPAKPTLQWAALPRALLARVESQSVPLARAFFVPNRQL